MSMYAKVRRMHFREKTPINEIARRTSLSRNTIKKWLKEPERAELRSARPPGATKPDPFIADLRQALEVDAHRPKRDRRTLLVLFRDLKSRGYSGSYSRLTVNVRGWLAQAGAVTARSAYVPLQFEWGEAFQFDWSEEGIVIGGVYRRIRLAHMKLCASRAFWLAQSLLGAVRTGWPPRQCALVSRTHRGLRRATHRRRACALPGSRSVRLQLAALHPVNRAQARCLAQWCPVCRVARPLAYPQACPSPSGPVCSAMRR